ncbi:MAG: hypothetical protein HY902_07070 [Deltaproteobacteria bacterium]|nr:hypothetical protein [Deltaproteobacteria bacterium]
MQFTCPACDGEFELSRRAFGTRTDTRTRCAACRTWLIVTRSADDFLTAVIDPDHEIDVAAVDAAKLTHAAPKPQVATPSRRPSAPPTPVPTAALAEVPEADLELIEEEPPPVVPAVPDEAADFFGAPRPRPSSASFEKLSSGQMLFSLPDPAESTKKRVQMQQVLQDFSVMFRLESKKSNRKQMVAMTLLGLLVAGGLWWRVRAKLAYDDRVDAARDAKLALPAWVLQSAQPEDVAVLGLPGQPTGTTTHHGTTLSRQLFMKARTQRPVPPPPAPKLELAPVAEPPPAVKPAADKPKKGKTGKPL